MGISQSQITKQDSAIERVSADNCGETEAWNSVKGAPSFATKKGQVGY